jgi:hypothetical protein
MGSDAEVFVFNYEKYIREVVPAFHEVLRTGQIPEWLQPVLKSRNIHDWSPPRTDLLRYCTYLAEDLSWDGRYEDDRSCDVSWQQRACKSDECPERGHCPFHRSDQGELSFELLQLFEGAVAIKCLGAGQFVGRSSKPIWYSEFLHEQGLKEDDRLFRLLAYLGKRGFLFGHTWSSGYEGIQGWLDPRETAELAWFLDHLLLPKYEASFDAMGGFHKPHPTKQLYEKFGITEYECPGFSFEALSLSFLRTVATIASSTDQGILWGNDLMTADFYLNYL